MDRVATMEISAALHENCFTMEKRITGRATHKVAGFSGTMIINLTCLLFPLFATACRTQGNQDDNLSNIAGTTNGTTDTLAIQHTKPVTITDLPNTGKDAASFIPEDFEIVLDAEGFLNNDDLLDMALVLQNKSDSTAARPCLVLFKQNDQTYSLAHISWKAAGPRYTPEGNLVYNTEDMSIDNGNLNFQMFDAGPAGNLSTIYKNIGRDLVLVEINTYNMGAGSHTELNYDLLNGTFSQTITHTMEDPMTSENKTKPYKIPVARFETADPLEIIHTAYKQAGE